MPCIDEMHGMRGRNHSRLKKEFFLNRYKEGKEIVIAVCDKRFLGKSFKEGKRQLEVSKNFYKGEEASEEKVKQALKEGTILNLVGEKTVSLGISLGLINKEKVTEIEGVKHAQMCYFRV